MVDLKVPKLRRQTFETAIIERYQRREASAERALIEMYLAGVSVRRVEDITEALCGNSPNQLFRIASEEADSSHAGKRARSPRRLAGCRPPVLRIAGPGKTGGSNS